MGEAGCFLPEQPASPASCRRDRPPPLSTGQTTCLAIRCGPAYNRSNPHAEAAVKHLLSVALSLAPLLVLVVGYGVNESFAGPAGLPAFTRGLDTLLDALAPAKARLVLLSPLRQGDMGRPLPDPAAQNKNLRLYADAIRDAARKRGCLYI